MKDRFAVIDALLWEPRDGYFLLDYHLRRLERSAAHFGFPLDLRAARQRLLDYAGHLPDQPRKVRLELAGDGSVTLRNENVRPSAPLAAVLASEPVLSHDPFLSHKTTRRELYEKAMLTHPEAQEVLLWNERGELTETCHGNVVLEIEGRRWTPPLTSGLLPGVFRAYLLDRGEILERILPVDTLQKASAVFMINSVRRWCEIRLLRKD